MALGFIVEYSPLKLDIDGNHATILSGGVSLTATVQVAVFAERIATFQEGPYSCIFLLVLRSFQSLMNLTSKI